MKPLELSCITGVWKSALQILSEATASIGKDLQLWFPWGVVWRGHSCDGTLPPTDFPDDMVQPGVTRFGGRLWKALAIHDSTWLISISAPKSATPAMENWELPDKAHAALAMLSDFVKLECLLGLSMRILENQAREQRGHWDRVRHLSVAIGQELGLSSKELADVEMAAMLHDLGKIGLPEEILEVAGPLDEESRTRVEAHSVVGSAMIREIPGMERIADFVLHHHESPDGSGYPRGLTRDDIPYGSLIIAVAEAFDAMTHYRPYAIEHTYEESFNEMKSQKGKFLPEVLDALERVLKNLGIFDTKPLVGQSADW